MYQIDVWIRYTNTQLMTNYEKYLETMEVDLDQDVQVLREAIRKKIPNPPDKIILGFCRTKIQEDMSLIGGAIDIINIQPPWITLSSDKSYPIYDLINYTPLEYPDNFELKKHITLNLLPRPKIIAIVFQECKTS